ncbi:MAG TPA: response regulator [Anaerolineales bacterium]|jgi:pilus assembly protein CpaE|nr:response regulator [Anaerolineales bacterium]
MKNILIIDDDPATTRLLEVLLTREGYNILTENLSDNALQTTKNFKPNLIFLDLMMPGVDGFEVCQEMKNDPELADIPILMFTSASQAEIRKQALAVGINEYITKPIHPNDLKQKIREWLDIGGNETS